MSAKACLQSILFLWACTVGDSALAQQTRTARDAFPVPASIRIVRNVVYAQYDQRQLKLDLYLPSSSAQSHSLPGILVVRGGGWQSGDKDAFGFIAGQLAKAGFVAVSIEYRTAAEAKFPAAIHDVKAAVRWLRAHANSYSVDPNAIGALGGSAGAHLVAMLATSSGVPELEGTGGNAHASSRVQAAVAMACVCDLQIEDPTVRAFIGEPLEAHAAAIQEGSPIAHVTRRSAPLLLLHSRTDPVVPYRLSVEMQETYSRAGALAVLKPVDAPQTHAFWNDARFFPQTINDAIDFFRANLKTAN